MLGIPDIQVKHFKGRNLNVPLKIHCSMGTEIAGT